jgi:plasmid stabilization system protein ParE
VNVTFAPEAIEDLSAAIAFLTERNLPAAVSLSDRVFAVVTSLAEGEFDGPEQALRRTGERVRSWPVPPFRIYYRREPNQFLVLRVYHSARRPIARLR